MGQEIRLNDQGFPYSRGSNLLTFVYNRLGNLTYDPSLFSEDWWTWKHLGIEDFPGETHTNHVRTVRWVQRIEGHTIKETRSSTLFDSLGKSTQRIVELKVYWVMTHPDLRPVIPSGMSLRIQAQGRHGKGPTHWDPSLTYLKDSESNMWKFYPYYYEKTPNLFIRYFRGPCISYKFIP